MRFREVCPVCGRYPCASGCPNADPPEAVLVCEECGVEIRDGEEYYRDIDGSDLCENCFDKWCRAHCKTASAVWA